MKIQRAALLLACAAALTGALLLARNPAEAGNTIDVTTIQDNENVDGNCSVREAIKAADENTVVDTCNGSTANTIQLPGSVIRVSNPLRPKSDMTIQGVSGSSAIDGQSFDRVFIISDSTIDFTVTLKDFQIQSGRTVAGGAGINNGEELTLDNMTMTNNEALAAGGAISNSPNGTLTILYSTIAGNFSRSGSGGGGIYNGGTLTVRDSAIRDNGDPALGANGGGISNLGTMILERVLIGDNTADTTVDPVDDGNGGGIYNSGTALLLNTTISVNTAANGGGIFNDEGGTLTLEYVTIANNTGLPDSGSAEDTDGIHNLGTVNVRSTIISNAGGSQDCNAANLTSNGGNVEISDNCGLHAASDKTGIDPQLQGRADNGGPTETHALVEGSPAIDAAVGKCPGVDQRGQPRPQGNGCDAGAFESSFTGPTPAPTPSPTPAPTGVPKKVAMGDVDCDLDVDSVDALKELRHVASLSVAQQPGCPAIGTDVASLFGDVDCDGDIDSVDSLKVLRSIAGLSVGQTEPCTDIGDPLN